MGSYARNTQVGLDRSKAEIEKILMRFGADKFMYGSSRDGAGIAFIYKGRTIKIELPLPPIEDFATTHSGKRQRTKIATYDAWQQACKESWRALTLLIKAKLAADENGITTFENEFLAYTCLPDGTPLGLHPELTKVIDTGKMPKLLIGDIG